MVKSPGGGGGLFINGLLSVTIIFANAMQKADGTDCQRMAESMKRWEEGAA